MEKKIRNVEHRKLQSIGCNYNYALKRMKELTRSRIYSESERQIKNQYRNYIDVVTRCYVKCNPLERIFLEKEYFAPSPKGWWYNIYSRSTYYRLRLATARKFLAFFAQ